MNTIPQPKRRIPEDAVKVWRLDNLIEDAIALVVLVGLLWAGYYFSWYHWIIIVLWILLCLMPISVVWSAIIDPKLLHKYWRYGITDEFVQLKRGIFKLEHTVVPMTKIQYVKATQGPLLRRYQLYTLSIGTIRSSHSIPALTEEEAFQLRDHIAEQAKLKEAD